MLIPMHGPLHVYLNGVEFLVMVYHPLFELAWKNLVKQQKSQPQPETAEFCVQRHVGCVAGGAGPGTLSPTPRYGADRYS
jgi:hypothetical protein